MTLLSITVLFLIGSLIAIIASAIGEMSSVDWHGAHVGRRRPQCAASEVTGD